MDYEALGDEELMLCIAKKDDAAFRVLVDRYLDKAVSFCTRMVRAGDAAEDIAQDTFAKIWRSAGTWQPTAKFSTWFFTVLHNASLNEIRKRKSHGETELEDIFASSEALQDERLMVKQRSELVQKALGLLPERQKSALVLCYYEGLSQREAAAVLNVTEGALESLLSRGRKTLEERLTSVIKE